MQWDHIRDGTIRVKQRKTGEVVWIPIDPVLAGNAPRINANILNSERGGPFSDSSGLARAIKRTLKLAGANDHNRQACA